MGVGWACPGWHSSSCFSGHPLTIIHHLCSSDHHSSPIIHHPEEIKCDPPASLAASMIAKFVWSRFWGKFVQIMSRMLQGRCCVQYKDLGASFWPIELVFRDLAVPTSPGMHKHCNVFCLVPIYFLTTFLHYQIAHRHKLSSK